LKFLIASDVIDVIAALLAVVVVYETTSRQRARIARLRGDETVEAPSIRTWRIGAGACLAVSLIVLAFVVGVAVTPSSASTEATKTARQVVADALKAAGAASSFHISRHNSSGKAGVDISFVRGKGATGSDEANGAKFDVAVIGNTTYLRGDSTFWRQSGAPRAEAQLLTDKWLKGPADSARFRLLTHEFSENTFLHILSSHGALASQGATTYKGRSVVAIQDAAGNTLYVMASGTPYPVAIVGSGDTLTFDRWNQPVTLTAPKGALDLSRLGSG
jgi:hypothetical protein